MTAGGDRQATTVDGWVTYQLVPNGNFPKPRNGFNVQFFVKAYRSGDPALAGIAAYRLVQVRSPAEPAAMTEARAPHVACDPVSEPFERGPARIGVALEVLVRLDVQVLPADRAEPGAVRPAEDLVRELERDRVARPRAELEVVAHDVVGVELVRDAERRDRGTRARATALSSSAKPRQRMHAPLRCASRRRSKTVAPDACEISSSTGIVAGDAS